MQNNPGNICSRYDKTCMCINDDYKDRKCIVNENLSVRIEPAASKTCDNRPLKNGSAVSNCSIVCW